MKVNLDYAFNEIKKAWESISSAGWHKSLSLIKKYFEDANDNLNEEKPNDFDIKFRKDLFILISDWLSEGRDFQTDDSIVYTEIFNVLLDFSETYSIPLAVFKQTGLFSQTNGYKLTCHLPDLVLSHFAYETYPIPLALKLKFDPNYTNLPKKVEVKLKKNSESEIFDIEGRMDSLIELPIHRTHFNEIVIKVPRKTYKFSVILFSDFKPFKPIDQKWK
jgi:hypothetical protein